MRQGKAESIQDCIFLEEILTVALKKGPAIDLDEKARGSLLMRTSNLTDREVSGIKIITQGQTQLAQIKKAITQTIVAKKSEEVRDDLREAGDEARDRAGAYAEALNFHLDGDSDDDEDLSSDQSERCTEETSTCDKVKKIPPKRWRPRMEHRKFHRRVEEGGDVQPMRCHWSLGRRLHPACQRPKEEIPLCKGQKKKSSVQKKI